MRTPDGERPGSFAPLDRFWEDRGLATAAAVVVFVVIHKNRLVIALVSPDIARAAGIDVRRLHLLFLMMFAMTVPTT